LSASLEELRELKSELSQVTHEYNSVGKVVINKAPAGHASPNRADSLMIAFAPVSSGVQLLGVWDADGFTELWG
jgi:phage terminase large subunit